MYDYHKYFLYYCQRAGERALTESAIFESSLSRIWSKAGKYDYAIISASRGDLKNKQNAANTDKLLRYLVSLGYSCTKLEGHFEEKHPDNPIHVVEVSFFVANQPTPTNKVPVPTDEFFRDIMVAGIEYEQESVLLKRADNPTTYLMGLEDMSDVPYPLVLNSSTGMPVGATPLGKISSGKELSQNYSRIKGKYFVFHESVENYVLPKIRGRYTFSPAVEAILEAKERTLDRLVEEMGERRGVEHFKRVYEQRYKQRLDLFTKMYYRE